MCLKSERGQAGDIRGDHVVTLVAQPVEGGIHVDRIPQYHEVDDDAERAELILLPLAVALAELAALAVKDDPGELVATLAAVELDQDAPAVALVIDESQEVE